MCLNLVRHVSHLFQFLAQTLFQSSVGRFRSFITIYQFLPGRVFNIDKVHKVLFLLLKANRAVNKSKAIGMSWFVSLCGHLIGDLTSSTCYASTIVPPAAFPSLTSLVLLMFNVDRWFRRSFKFLQLQSQQVSTSSSFAAMAIEV